MSNEQNANDDLPVRKTDKVPQDRTHLQGYTQPANFTQLVQDGGCHNLEDHHNKAQLQWRIFSNFGRTEQRSNSGKCVTHTSPVVRFITDKTISRYNRHSDTPIETRRTKVSPRPDGG
jgi:hypothetical protein